MSTADFCLLSSSAYNLPREERARHLLEAVHNLEILTGRKLENPDDPLLIAVRSALPEYLPGFMPTYLNVGLIPSVFAGLPRRYGKEAAGLIRLNNRKTILEALDPKPFDTVEKDIVPFQPPERVLELCETIEGRIARKAPELLDSAVAQLLFFQQRAYEYYESRLDALRNFMIKKTYYPALILQRMVCTVIDDRSYPGVLYSRHPRRGSGVFVQFARRAFGEDLMTGRLQPEERTFFETGGDAGGISGHLSFLGSTWAARGNLPRPGHRRVHRRSRDVHDSPGQPGRAGRGGDADGGDGYAPRRPDRGRPRPGIDQALSRPSDRVRRHRPQVPGSSAAPRPRGFPSFRGPRFPAASIFPPTGSGRPRPSTRAKTSSWPSSDSRPRTPWTCPSSAAFAA